MSSADKLAQVLAEHGDWGYGREPFIRCDCGAHVGFPDDDGRYKGPRAYASHVAAVVLAHLTAEGWGNLAPARIVLADREAELLEVKGPCSFKQCRLHHGHRGPCDTRRVTDWEPVETGDQE